MIFLPKLSSLERKYTRLLKEPLAIECHLSTPVVVYRWLFFDGILAYAVMEPLLDTISPSENDAYYIPLPLERRGSEQWYWAASVSFYNKGVWSRTKWTKHYRTWQGEDYGYGVLEFRYDMPMPLLSVETLHFFAVGNKREVEKLLQRVTHVGKKRVYGYGCVKEWKVSTIDNDYSEVYKNILSRPIPISECRYEVVGFQDIVGFRPPYWCPENFTLCWLPGGSCSVPI